MEEAIAILPKCFHAKLSNRKIRNHIKVLKRNDSLDTKVNKREYVNSVIGTTAITVDNSVYQINCIVLPYPDAQNKQILSLCVDIGVLDYVTKGSTYTLNVGDTNRSAQVKVTKNSNNYSVELSDVKWSGTNLTESARLIVYTIK